MTSQGEAIFDELPDQWKRQIGSVELDSFETHLAASAGVLPEFFDTPGWIAQNEGEPG